MDTDDAQHDDAHFEPEFQLVLLNPGPQRARVIVLVQHLLNLSPVEARRQVDHGQVLLAEGLSHWDVGKMKSEFEALGAVVEVR